MVIERSPEPAHECSPARTNCPHQERMLDLHDWSDVLVGCPSHKNGRRPRRLRSLASRAGRSRRRIKAETGPTARAEYGRAGLLDRVFSVATIQRLALPQSPSGARPRPCRALHLRISVSDNTVGINDVDRGKAVDVPFRADWSQFPPSHEHAQVISPAEIAFRRTSFSSLFTLKTQTACL